MKLLTTSFKLGGDSGARSSKHVVLNCANIGCDYGENHEKRQENKFSWGGVERAFNFYDSQGYIVHAIIGQRLLQKAGRRASSQPPGLVSGAFGEDFDYRGSTMLLWSFLHGMRCETMMTTRRS